MTERDKTYELIVNNLIGEISEEEQNLLDKEISKDASLRRGFHGLLTFWKNYFPKHQHHNIIEKTNSHIIATEPTPKYLKLSYKLFPSIAGQNIKS